MYTKSQLLEARKLGKNDTQYTLLKTASKILNFFNFDTFFLFKLFKNCVQSLHKFTQKVNELNLIIILQCLRKIDLRLGECLYKILPH